MIRFTRERVARWLERLLHVDDTPRRTAAAYALGVFFGFSPFLGLHTVLALACAFALSLNRVAVVLGVYSNLPWIIAPYYAVATATGAWLTGADVPGVGADMWQTFEHSPLDTRFWTWLRPLLWPYTVGSTIGALVLALVAYRGALALILARRRAHGPRAPGGNGELNETLDRAERR
jgi:uncharacterized protein (DUF2062 family)